MTYPVTLPAEPEEHVVDALVRKLLTVETDLVNEGLEATAIALYKIVREEASK